MAGLDGAFTVAAMVRSYAVAKQIRLEIEYALLSTFVVKCRIASFA
jgi:hypothetical protein